MASHRQIGIELSIRQSATLRYEALGNHFFISFRLPELDWISFRVVQTSEAPIRIHLRIDSDVNPGGTKLLDDGREISHAKIDHPVFFGIAEILAVLRKRSKNRRPGFLYPGLLGVIRRYEINA
jgi:hypothetical protein